MKTFRTICGRGAALAAALGFLAMGSSALAQDAGNDKPISLTFQNAPITAVLRTLFSSAGIANYSIDPDVQGFVNISVQDAPFNVAESQLLKSVRPQLKDTIENGSHHISVVRAEVPVPVAVPTGGTAATGGADVAVPTAEAKRFYKIPVDHYDSAFLAYQMYVGGIHIIPADPAAGGGGGQGGFGGQQGGFGGQRGGFGGQQGGFGGQQGGFGGQQGGFGGQQGIGGGIGFGGGGGGFGGGGFGGGGFGGGGRGYVWGR